MTQPGISPEAQQTHAEAIAKISSLAKLLQENYKALAIASQKEGVSYTDLEPLFEAINKNAEQLDFTVMKLLSVTFLR